MHLSDDNHFHLVGCRGAVVVLLTPAVAALVGCRGAVGGLLTPTLAVAAVASAAAGAAPSAGCARRLSPPFRLGMNQRCVFVFPLAY